MRTIVLMVLVCGLAVLSVAGCGSRSPRTDPGQTQPAHPPVQQEEGMGGPQSIPGLQAEVVPSFSFYPIVASRSQKLVHRASCPQLRRLPDKDRQYFRGYFLAEKEGFKPCPECRPDRP